MKHHQTFKELAQFLAATSEEKDIEKILKDLLTPQEITKVLERLEIIKQLNQKKPQRAIKQDLNVSIALVTRGSHALQKNHGGFPLYLQYITHKKKEL